MRVEQCTVCGVRKVGEAVFFQVGPDEEPAFRQSTEERLQARVCQHTAEPNCINRGKGLNFSEDDEYGDPKLEQYIASELGWQPMDHDAIAQDLIEEFQKEKDGKTGQTGEVST